MRKREASAQRTGLTRVLEPAKDEAEIRMLIETRLSSVRAKNVEGATANIAADILAFDVVNPLEYVGRDAIRARAEEWFSSFTGPIGFEVRDLKIAASGDVGFSHCLNRVSATFKDGQKLEMWWRCTACYRKRDGEWVLTHEHNSVPFDPQTGRASLDLTP